MMPLEQLAVLASIIKCLKFPLAPADDYRGSYPVWAFHKFKPEDLLKEM